MQPRTPGAHLSRIPCAVCGGPLTVHEAVRGGYCAKPACRHRSLMREIDRREAMAAALLAQRVADAQATVIASLGLKRESVAIAVVPASNRHVVKLPRKRKTAFRRHLAGILAESIRQNAEGTAPSLTPDDLPSAPQFNEETGAVRDGCATCRGYCCRLGAGAQAFLDVATLCRYRALEPQLRPKEVVAAYVSRIPDMSVENSCVFHGASGCTLPRPMRASICNVYHCGGLERMQGPLSEPGVEQILIVAASESAIVRWSVHDKLASREQHAGEPGPLDESEPRT